MSRKNTDTPKVTCKLVSGMLLITYRRGNDTRRLDLHDDAVPRVAYDMHCWLLALLGRIWWDIDTIPMSFHQTVFVADAISNAVTKAREVTA